MNVTCPHCRTTVDLDTRSLEAKEIQIKCPGCREPFSLTLRKDDFPLSPGEGLATDVLAAGLRRVDELGEEPGQPDERTEPVPLRGRFWIYTAVVVCALSLAVLLHTLLRKVPEAKQPVLPPPTEVPVVSPEPEPTAVPTREPEIVFSPPSQQRAEAEEEIDLEPFRRELLQWTPTALKNLRPKLVEALQKEKFPPHDLEVMIAQAYAYLGGRQKKKDWISYGYEMAYRSREREPDDPEAQKALLLAFLSAKKFDQALPTAREMISLHPNDPIFAICFGEALIGEGKSSEGLKVLEQAHRKFPKSFPVAEALGKVYLEKDRYREAEAMGRKLLEREPQDPIAAQILGDAFEGGEKWAELSLLYEPLAQTNPEDWHLRFSLGRAYRMTKQFGPARAELDAVLAGEELVLSLQDRAQIYLERGKVEFDQEKYADSIPFFKRSYELNRSDPPTVLFLAGALYREKRYGEAAVIYAEALKLEPRNLQTQRYLGMALLESGDTSEAEKHLKAVVRGGEEDASLYYHLSRIREASGDRSGAIAYLEAALRKDPDYRNAKIRLEKLLSSQAP